MTPLHLRKLFSFAVIVGVLIHSAVASAWQNPPTGNETQQQIQTLAVVNGQPVTRQQVANECLRRFGEDVLESIINKQLVLNECRRQGLMVTEKDVNDEIINRAKKFGMSGERWIKLICSRRNITPDRLKNDVIWQELALRRLAASSLKVSKEELDERLEFEFGSRIQVREIALNSASRAKQLHAQAVANPTDFGRLAKEYSINPMSASVRGLLPPVRRHSGFLQFEQVAFSLQPGQISDVFQVEDVYIILRCEKIFPATEIGSEQLGQIQERIVDEIRNEKLATAASELFKRLQRTVKIANVINDPVLSKQMPGVAAVVDDKQITKRYLAEECIARFGTEMLETEINRAILLQAMKKKGKQIEQNDTMAEIKRAAESFGYLKKDGTVDVEAWLAFVTNNDLSKVDFYVEDEVWPTVALKKLIEGTVNVTQEDMKKAFEANFGPRVEVLAVVNSDHRTALKVWQMATANPSEEYFGQLAEQYSSETSTRSFSGQVPPIQRHGGRPELEKEAFSLKRGEISKVVQVGDYWFVLYCQGRTTPRVTDFDAVKDELQSNIMEKKMRIAMAEAYDTLRRRSQIDNFLAGTSQSGNEGARTAKQQGRNLGNR